MSGKKEKEKETQSQTFKTSSGEQCPSKAESTP
jgi:hypothetical protein